MRRPVQNFALQETGEVVDTLLKQAREKAGYKSAAEFARSHGFPEVTYRSHENGTRPLTVGAAKQYAPKLGIDWRDLIDGDDAILSEVAPAPTSDPAPTVKSSDLSTSRIPEVDVRGGMGGGGVTAVEFNHTDEWGNQVARDDVRGEWDMPADYVRHELRVVPSRVQIIEVRGDSMEPVLQSRDRVMIDLDDTDPGQGGIFAIWDGMSVLVKRIERIHKSDPPAVRVISDNPNHSPFELVLDDGGGRIIGRAVWFGRRM